MSLKDAIDNAQKDNKNEKTSGKNPSFYTKQNKEFINEACKHADVTVRTFAAGSIFTPTGLLKDMLKTETDKDVLSVLLQNPRIPNKSLKTFVESDNVEMFDETDTAYQVVLQRLNGDDDDDSGMEDTD